MEIVFYVLIAALGVLLIVGLSIASYAGSHVVEKYRQTERYMASSFVTAKDFAVMTSVNFLDRKVRVGARKGFLSDAYSSSQKIVFLSEEVYHSSSVAALAVAAHELGHALQDKKNPQTLKRHRNLIIAGKFFGYLMMPMAAVGVVFFFARPDNILFSLGFLGGAVGIFFLALVLKIMTISIEKEASKNALMLLDSQSILNQEELLIAKKLLKAALLTYIADFLRVILSWTFLTKKTKLFS
jgi:Zn-dependent membrane protease YugP